MAISDIVIGPARVFYAPVATALPDETSVAYGATWTNWTELGTTLEPVSVNFERTMAEITVEQALSAVRRPVESESLTIETVLAEMTAVNLALALGGTATSTNAGAGQKAFFQIEAGGEPELTEYAWGFEGYTVIAGVKQPVRWLFYKGIATLGGALEFGKSNPAGISLQVQVLPDLTKIAGKQLLLMQRVTAAAST